MYKNYEHTFNTVQITRGLQINHRLIFFFLQLSVELEITRVHEIVCKLFV